jgi:hypothetical protein
MSKATTRKRTRRKPVGKSQQPAEPEARRLPSDYATLIRHLIGWYDEAVKIRDSTGRTADRANLVWFTVIEQIKGSLRDALIALDPHPKCRDPRHGAYYLTRPRFYLIDGRRYAIYPEQHLLGFHGLFDWSDDLVYDSDEKHSKPVMNLAIYSDRHDVTFAPPRTED